jgi:hypothetical protein
MQAWLNVPKSAAITAATALPRMLLSGMIGKIGRDLADVDSGGCRVQTILVSRRQSSLFGPSRRRFARPATSTITPLLKSWYWPPRRKYRIG